MSFSVTLEKIRVALVLSCGFELCRIGARDESADTRGLRFGEGPACRLTRSLEGPATCESTTGDYQRFSLSPTC